METTNTYTDDVYPYLLIEKHGNESQNPPYMGLHLKLKIKKLFVGITKGVTGVAVRKGSCHSRPRENSLGTFIL